MMNQRNAATPIADALTSDHARLDARFDAACALVGAGDFTLAAGAFDEFARGLSQHIAVEERFLFPAFDARAGMPGPTMVMRHEHRAIQQLLALAAASIAARDAGLFAGEAAELAALLAAHNMKEERVIYPRCDAALDDAERAQLLSALVA